MGMRMARVNRVDFHLSTYLHDDMIITRSFHLIFGDRRGRLFVSDQNSIPFLGASWLYRVVIWLKLSLLQWRLAVYLL
jgi:hypothetical protein